MILSRTISTLIKSGIRYLTLRAYGKTDARTAPEAAPYGVDSNPVAGLQAIYIKSTIDGKAACIGYINTQQLSEVGEMRLFSTDDEGTLQTYLWLKANGDILMGGDTNFAVMFNELKTEFNKLKTDYNNLVTSYNGHTHILTLSAGTGTAAPTVSSGASNTSNIDNAKNPKIKTNS